MGPIFCPPRKGNYLLYVGLQLNSCFNFPPTSNLTISLARCWSSVSAFLQKILPYSCARAALVRARCGVQKFRELRFEILLGSYPRILFNLQLRYNFLLLKTFESFVESRMTCPLFSNAIGLSTPRQFEALCGKNAAQFSNGGTAS